MSVKGNIIANEVPTHIDNWTNAPEELGETEWSPAGGSFSNWEYKISRFKQFFAERFDHTLDHYRIIFGNDDRFTLQINVRDSSQRKVVLHENKMEVAPDYSGQYFSDIPMRVEAVPEPGFVFVKWLEIDKCAL